MDFSNSVIETIKHQLREYGYPIQPFQVDVDDYQDFFSKAGYAHRYPHYYSNNLLEKSLEHYLAAKMLKLTSQDIYIDIASESSPVPEIYHRLYGAITYRQDIVYPPGLNGDMIGGDAASIPVPDGFASKMGLHCSLEHFEGDADIRFFLEAKRVLIPGGKICVVPLYLYKEYSIVTDPEIATTQNVNFEPDATLRCVDGWGNRYGRFYNPMHFVNRILKNLDTTKVTIYHINNSKNVDPSCYALFALLVEI
jgi:SAM-dependent methyltransferase